MTRKAYRLIELILEFGDVCYKGGSGKLTSKEYLDQFDKLDEEICKKIKELDERGKNHN